MSYISNLCYLLLENLFTITTKYRLEYMDQDTIEITGKSEENKALMLRFVNRGMLAETFDRELAIMEEIDKLKGKDSDKKLDKLLSEFSETVKLRKRLEKRYKKFLEESTA